MDKWFNEAKALEVELSTALARVKELVGERSELWTWFEHHHVTGTLTLEQIDRMTPKQMADHAYERMAEKVESLQAQLHQRDTALAAVKEALVEIKEPSQGEGMIQKILIDNHHAGYLLRKAEEQLHSNHTALVAARKVILELLP